MLLVPNNVTPVSTQLLNVSNVPPEESTTHQPVLAHPDKLTSTEPVPPVASDVTPVLEPPLNVMIVLLTEPQNLNVDVQKDTLIMVLIKNVNLVVLSVKLVLMLITV